MCRYNTGVQVLLGSHDADKKKIAGCRGWLLSCQHTVILGWPYQPTTVVFPRSSMYPTAAGACFAFLTSFLQLGGPWQNKSGSQSESDNQSQKNTEPCSSASPCHSTKLNQLVLASSCWGKGILQRQIKQLLWTTLQKTGLALSHDKKAILLPLLVQLMLVCLNPL